MTTTPGRQFKDEIFEQFARIGKAVSSAKRIELLDLLAQGPRHVEALADESGLTVANTSRHLQILRAARLVETERSGTLVIYRLADRSVADFVRQIRLLAESRLAEVERTLKRFLESRIGFETVDQAELLRRVAAGEVTVLDVRPPDEYAEGHLPHAICLPLEELQERMKDLPHDREIVAYCRGPYCVMAVEAVARLRERGFKAVRLELSVLDWQSCGYPVARGVMPGGSKSSTERRQS
jgi:rhodanese-related sulfurtransferase/DNA-binding transcriptional ArsR family regulator